MISLDLDLSYLSRNFHIATSELKYYRNMSLEQIMAAETEKGNTAAAEFMLKLTNNPDELCKLFKLISPTNRYLILKNLNQEDLMNVMQYLSPEELILGLSIFNPEMIIELMKRMEPESLATLVLENMEPEKFLKCLPEKFLDEFLCSDKINREMIMKGLEDIDEKQLQKMIANVTGVECNSERDEILKQLDELSDENFMKVIGAAEPEGKQQLIFGMLKEKPELFEEFSADAMTYPFQSMEKEDILKSLTVLETSDMLPMVEDLPRELMAIIATQISPDIFSKILCSDFKDIIAGCGSAIS